MGNLLTASGVPATSEPGYPCDMEQGIIWSVSADTSIVGMRWYRKNTNAAHKPLAMRIWTYEATPPGELMVSVPAIEDDETVGWQYCPFAAPFQALAGVDYIGSMSLPDGDVVGMFPLADIEFLSPPFTIGANPRARYAPCGYAYPGTISNDKVYAVDVVPYTPPAGGEPGLPGDPPTNENITARLGDWFSNDPDIQEHETDGVPWLTKLLVEAVQAGVDEAVGMLEALIAVGVAVRFGNIDDMMTAIKAVVDEFPISNAAEHTTTREGIAANGVALIALGKGTNLTRDTQPVPGDGWTLSDTIMFSGTSAWAVPADRYVYNITGWGENRVVDYRDGVQMLWYRGWAAPLNGTLVGRHQTINAVSGEIYEPGMKWPGVIFSAPPDIEVTLEAWVYG